MAFDLLKDQFDFLSPLPPATWAAFSALFSERRLKRHAYFAEAGRVEKEIGVLTNGVFRAFYRDANGTEFNKAFFQPTDLIGAYASLVTGQSNQIFFQALSDATVWTARYVDIVALFDQHPSIERLARRITENLFIRKDKREVELVLLSATERYALFQQEYPGLENKIAQYHVASYLGVTPTQLSRIRAQGRA